MVEDLAQTIGKELQDKDNFKSEKDLGTKKTMAIVLIPRTVTPKHRHTIIKRRWARTKWGSFTWGTDKWYDSEYSTITTLRVVNPERKFIDNFFGTTFKDTSSTNADWSTTGEIVFATNQTASSLSIYLNNETISSATLIATATGGGSIGYLMSADGGSNWENVTSGISHTFTNQGTDLRWRATGSNMAIQSIEIEY